MGMMYRPQSRSPSSASRHHGRNSRSIARMISLATKAGTGVLLLSALALACGGASAPAASAASAADVAPSPSSAERTSPGAAESSSTDPSAPAAAAASGPGGLPTACVDASAPVCTPPGGFVDRLCAKPHQEIALALFGKTPFSRLYLKGKMDELDFQEEVIALRFHGQAKGGMQVGSGHGTYDVLRWDGSCAMAVDADILGTSAAGRSRTARVQWHRIGDKQQNALIAGSDAVKKAHARRGKECQGAMSGDVSAACQKADAALVDAIVEYVRGGGSLPTPDAP